ncbi:putative disease resistance protein RGA3 [Ziziphus jujuba]|uniref:Disease resistance protein RGA3 n=1 Tax=Ziziphus jujuba TaxID=326968 RepID=A0ABM4A1R0_ZIZJJ|nr:putative disease resistance protein RGA3 [Ziziphus jujuba]XP_060670653.1 putative disease resistance protein RGA3 [Ziziphus jujuba]XP_060670654.1 putative disease resistance protein RGA3 [Ziziphus jujuba]XP_060670655.1 putative disease resistance protein RGA3 [Ziziphus jujuba]XP_060670656.1 putative disease resistance protein RGA3 [Ziziphus jujuba]XP_060670657.1 putative disease resistance protein RGA3 [Ziziphus jujuba]
MAADIILSSIAKIIIEELRKVAVKQIASLWGVDDDLQQLEGTISIINSVLADAERKQVQNQQIKTWLERLEDAVYEVDDLVDKISTEALQQQVMTGNIMAKQVRIFCSTSNQFAFRYKMGQKIRFLRRKLDKIADDRMKFHLETGLPLDTHVVTVEPEEHSYERKENVIGRDYEQTEIIKRLFDMNNEENLAVIPIVGVGGLGKTTLARLVYNDAEVRKHFELVMWVNVPKVFDVKLVVKEIMKPEVRDEKTMDELQQDLRLKIGGKQFLLVLDDVWDIDSREKWLKLEELLKDGANRSRIIVTTRDKKIAHVINGREERTYNLGILNDEMAWCLFTKLAFVHRQEPNDPNLVGIGKDIVKKCGGIPLVIRTIASMLYCKNFEEWSSFKGMELSAIDEYDKNIIPILKLSYDHLPSYLKHCFGYCSLFPKNYVFDVEILINLWMAQGFIKLSNDHNQSLEDSGYQHFKNLLYRSFFEVVEIDYHSSKVIKCKMHDCMHDLATLVMGTKGVVLSSDDEKTDERTRHVAFNDFYLGSLQQVQALLVNTKRIRTIFKRDRYYDLSYRVLEESILKCKFLRTLDLQYSSLKRLPASIDKLKHLRYLDLSRNDMKALPNSITRLQNLQTLNVSYCQNLQEIPSGITKMFNLRHLHIESYSGTTLHGMPGGLDQLTNLQRLSLLPQGDLWNQWIPLNNESFILHHISNWKTLDMRGIDDLQHLPDGLKSFTCLQKLRIERCLKLESLSPGLNHLTSLLNLSIKGCPELESIFPSLYHLTSLQRLEIGFCDKLEMSNGGSDATIQWQRFESLSVLILKGLSKLVALSQWLQQLTSLQEIQIIDCPKLKLLPEWIGSLETLEIRECPILLERCRDDIGDYWPLICNINQLILSPVGREAEFSREGVDLQGYQSIPMNSESFFYHLSNLKFLNICYNGDLQHLPDGLKRLTSLETLDIGYCSKLQSLSPGLYHLTSLKRLYIFGIARR